MINASKHLIIIEVVPKSQNQISIHPCFSSIAAIPIAELSHQLHNGMRIGLKIKFDISELNIFLVAELVN